MMRNALKVIGCLMMVLGLASLCFAATSTPPITVRASIPEQNGLSVTISKIDASNDVWDSVHPSSIDFENLYFDATYNIFRANYYYAVDVGCNSNAADWTITHTTTSMTNGSEDLDYNINVTFMKQTSSSTAVDLPNNYVSFASSNGKYYTKSNLSGGWLRIYYGIATGSGDASGVIPITTDKPFGTYQGSVTLTLTP